MVENRLENVRVAAIMTDGFEQIEFTYPRDALVAQGAVVHIISLGQRIVHGVKHQHPSDKFEVDKPIDEASSEDYDAVLLPGGVVNSDKLRTNESVQNFLRDMNDENKPIFAICHAPWTLISAGLTRGRVMTSYHSLKDDLINAGAMWVDEPVVTDENLVTSRHPGDLEAFTAHMIEMLAHTPHAEAHAKHIKET